jgi:hypothetical protein
MWSVAGVYACDGAEAVSTSRRAVCVPIIKKKWTMILKIEMLSICDTKVWQNLYSSSNLWLWTVRFGWLIY